MSQYADKGRNPGTAQTATTGLESADLTHIARTVAGDHSVRVLKGSPGGGSFANLETRTLTIDPEHEGTIGRFVAAHEGAHLSDTATFDQIGVEPKDQVRKLGLLALKNAIEDGSINDRFVRDFPGLEKDALAAYPRKSGELGFPMHPEIIAHAQALGFMPKYATALAAVLQDWSELRHERGFSRPDKEYRQAPYMGADPKDDAIARFLKRALPDVRDAIAKKYKPNATGDEKLAAAIERHILCEKVVYPELKKLIEADLERLTNEGPKKRPPNQHRQTGKQQPQKSGATCNNPGSKAEQDASDADGQSLDQEVDGQGKSRGKNNTQEDSTQEDGQQKQGTAGSEKKQRDNKPKSGEGEKSAAEREQEEKERREFQSLPEAERRRQAKESLGAFDDAVREALKGLFDKQDDAPKTVEVVVADNNDERQAEAKAAAHEAFQKAGKGLRDALLRSLSPYQRYYTEVVGKIDEIEGRLRDVFIPNMHFRWERNQPSGPKITMTQAMKFEATGEGYRELFERRIDPTRPDIAVVVLVDRSGSMSGEKIESAVRGAIFSKEVFQRIGVRCAIVGFADQQELLCDFQDDTQEQATQERFMSGLAVGGGTQDAQALRYGAGLLQDLGARRGAVVVISDAQSGEGGSLAPLVRAVESDGIPVLHFGIGEDTVDTAGLYTRSFGGLAPSQEGKNSFFETFAREMEKLAIELG